MFHFPKGVGKSASICSCTERYKQLQARIKEMFGSKITLIEGGAVVNVKLTTGELFVTSQLESFSSPMMKSIINHVYYKFQWFWGLDFCLKDVPDSIINRIMGVLDKPLAREQEQHKGDDELYMGDDLEGA